MLCFPLPGIKVTGSLFTLGVLGFTVIYITAALVLIHIFVRRRLPGKVIYCTGITGAGSAFPKLHRLRLAYLHQIRIRGLPSRKIR